MSTLEERIATLEGRMTPDLREEVQRGFGETRQEFAAVREEMHRSAAELRAEMHAGFVELREDMARMRQDLLRGFERVDDRMHRHFTWIVGIQLTTMITIIGVLAAAFVRSR